MATIQFTVGKTTNQLLNALNEISEAARKASDAVAEMWGEERGDEMTKTLYEHVTGAESEIRKFISDNIRENTSIRNQTEI